MFCMKHITTQFKNILSFVKMEKKLIFPSIAKNVEKI